jgi:transcriptional regulator with PAS, ATPase and Fis domain
MSVKEHDRILQEKLVDLTEVHKTLKDAVRGTKEQTSAIVDKLSNELEYAKRQISLISEIVVDGILLVNNDGIILSANKAIELIFCTNDFNSVVGTKVSAYFWPKFHSSRSNTSNS